MYIRMMSRASKSHEAPSTTNFPRFACFTHSGRCGPVVHTVLDGRGSETAGQTILLGNAGGSKPAANRAAAGETRGHFDRAEIRGGGAAARRPRGGRGVRLRAARSDAPHAVPESRCEGAANAHRAAPGSRGRGESNYRPADGSRCKSPRSQEGYAPTGINAGAGAGIARRRRTRRRAAGFYSRGRRSAKQGSAGAAAARTVRDEFGQGNHYIRNE